MSASEEKEAFRRREQLNLPPGYEEAVASSSHSDVGDESRETSHLLGAEDDNDDDNDDQDEPRTQRQRRDGYQPPTVRSVRSSFDSNSSYASVSARTSTESLRREIQQMDIEEPSDRRPSRLRRSLSKQLYRFGGAISSLGSSVGSRFGWLSNRMPNFPWVPGLSDNKIITLQRLLGALIALVVIYAIFVSELFTISNPMTTIYDPELVKNYVLEHIELPFIRHDLEYLSSFDHVAGTEGDFVLADYISGRFRDAGLQNVHTEEYEVYLNYPKEGGRRVAIVDPPSMFWEAKIEEEEFSKENQNPKYKQTRVFHGHSKSGNVTGPLVYANYGSRDDFAKLAKWKIDVKGAVVLVRYGGTEGDRALKVKAAHDAGAIGCIIYSDPKENGFTRGKVWPEGPWSPEDAVQRGSVALTGIMAGDVLTPGKPSLPDAERLNPDDSPGLVKIPSLPLAWRDAQQLLKALKGHGQQLKDEAWEGAVPEVEWWTGDQNSPKVNLMNEQVEKNKQKIWNVLGSIRGYEQPDKMVIIGNHRDAWCYGSADPMSGTAVMLEIARVFGDMLKQNWRPLRTIEFASWDAEEYNMVGSTEWVEEHIDGLRQDGVAYINVDVAVSGKNFNAMGTPNLQEAVLKVLERLQDPITNQSLREVWGDRKMEGLGGGSDYIAFQDVAGTSSIDLFFEGEGYPYHSCYDNFKWMEAYGDPTFEYHALMGKIWGLLILELADSFILPINYYDYSVALIGYLDDLEVAAVQKAGSAEKLAKKGISFQALRNEIEDLKGVTERFHKFKQEWEGLIMASSGMENTVLSIRRMGFNTKLSNFETFMLDNAGMPGRTFYKHPIFAPKLWNTYDAAYFPGVRDAVDNADWKLAKKQIERVREIINTAKKMAFQSG